MVPNVSKQSEVDNLKSELIGLFKHIQKIRVEIAMIKSPKGDQFSTMTDELDSIVESTSTATDEIMSNVEQIGDIAYSMSEKLVLEVDKKAMNEISDRVTNVIVACSFQDITGQRIQKVVKAIRYIEDHITSLINIWGQDVIYDQKVEKPAETDEYKKYLNGPQLKGQGVNQNDVDAMFEGSSKPQVAPQVKLSVQPQVKVAPAAQPAAPQVKLATPQPQVKLSQPQVAPKPAEKAAPVGGDAPPALDQNSIDALFD